MPQKWASLHYYAKDRNKTNNYAIVKGDFCGLSLVLHTPFICKPPSSYKRLVNDYTDRLNVYKIKRYAHP